MENMDKGLIVPKWAKKWVLTIWLKIIQMPQNLSAQFVCPSPKVWDFNEKGFIDRPWFTGSNNQSGLNNFVHQKD